MKNECDVAVITNRLKRVEGQIRGIIKMLEDNKPCGELLIQIASARGALQKIAQSTIENYIRNCLEKGIEEGKSGKIFESIKDVIEQFSRIV
jgi:DNA-binding FrmR family transcriptional regulator